MDKFHCHKYRPSGVVSTTNLSSDGGRDQQGDNGEPESYFRYGTLPGENVCTENLTPWKKLLPCQDKRGLAGLLNARSIHRTKYHSIGLTLRTVCPPSDDSSGSSDDCDAPLVELSQHVTLVLDPYSFPENRRNDNGKKYDWSIRSLFGIGINSRCPLADVSNIYVNLPNDKEANNANSDILDLIQVQPATPSRETISPNGHFRIRTYQLGRLIDQGEQINMPIVNTIWEAC